jgi:AcrR family transcriptional regulator
VGPVRNSAEAAQQTRERIVAASVAHSSTTGLAGLTLGSLAQTLGMSKAGVVGPFGSRLGLQRSVVSKAGEMFTAAVIEPSFESAPGLERLRAVVDHWCAYLSDSPFPNGCFMTAASCELDGHPGELRDAVRDMVLRWRAFLRHEVATAQASGELDRSVDPEDAVCVLNGIAMSANQEVQLLADTCAGSRARRLMLTYLESLSADPQPYYGA